MENAQNTVSVGQGAAGSSLAAAVERLGNVLGAFEARLNAIQAGGNGESPGAFGDHAPLLREIEALKAREHLLEVAASGAFDALGAAAADIRQIVNEQAA